MNLEVAATRVMDLTDKSGEKLEAVLVVYADSRFDRDRNIDAISHGTIAVCHQFWLGHQACPDTTLLNPVAGAAAVQVHFLVASQLDPMRTLGQLFGITATQLEGNGFVPGMGQQEVAGTIQDSAGRQHLAVEH